jgi:hypothetical protein
VSDLSQKAGDLRGVETGLAVGAALAATTVGETVAWTGGVATGALLVAAACGASYPTGALAD